MVFSDGVEDAYIKYAIHYNEDEKALFHIYINKQL